MFYMQLRETEFGSHPCKHVDTVTSFKTIFTFLKEHIQEIFSVYGKIKMIDMPLNRVLPHLSKCYAYVEFETPEEAEKALKHMDGGRRTWRNMNLGKSLLQ